MVVRIISSCGTKKILLEAQQELSDGSFRPQGREPGEKMKAGESSETAAYRAVKEESLDECCLIMYTLHWVKAYADGLPVEDFCTDEDEYNDCGAGGYSSTAVTVKKHFWTGGAIQT
ncbi:hypothetical protein D5086_020212 [Populus alba]|uniref:Uncharacterized protein n=1 Tax=Populus alba TaxID=43335 RepID=A0ACC4BJE4_POPAL